MVDERRLREKLRDAALSVTNDDRPRKERLEAAFLYGISGLEPEDFPDEDGRQEFEAINSELVRYDELLEGAGSVSTTIWTMDTQR